MMTSVRLDCMTVTQMQTVRIQTEVLSVLAMMDFLETGKLVSVINIYHLIMGILRGCNITFGSL